MSRVSTRYTPGTGDIAAQHEARYGAFTQLQHVARQIREG
jgi:D-ribulokinase